jgi:biopolymer transport protein ExbD
VRRRRLRGDDLPIRADINVTSLVDVAFVLLVIFIITAPILQGGVEVNLPRGDVQPVTSAERPFIVTVRPDGTVFVEETALSLEEFEVAFPQLAEAGTFERVYIRGDSLSYHGTMMRVIATVASTGKPLLLVAEPRENR